jgi:two-component system response regulator GlrR
VSERDKPATRRLSDKPDAVPLRVEGGSLVVLEGPDRGRRFAVGSATMSIGSGAENEVVLADDTVSRRHLAIEESDDGWVVRDLKSTNGTKLDGTRVREAFLAVGAVIELGATKLRFEAPGECVLVPPSAATSFGALHGASPRMRQIFGILERVAASDATVLLRGETGTGKEVAAQSLHEASPRAKKPFVVIDASATPRDLFESILFGHRKGAFTGAADDRRGAFATADGGTVFIDEIGELPLDLQPKLLRVLERREVLALGSDKPQKVDVRVLAATHRDLRAMVREGEFRQDLYYRLSVIEVTLPPLRQRREDIPELVRFLLDRAGRADLQVAPAALQALSAHGWDGNVRELKNVIDRAVVFCERGPIERSHLDLIDGRTTPAGGGADGDRTLDDVEAEAIRATLERTGGNRTEAAKILGISRRSLIDRIARHGLTDAGAPPKKSR